MKKLALTLSLALASMFAATAYAQKDVPGEARGAPTTAATPAEKAAAKQARVVEGKAVAKAGTGAEDKVVPTGKKVAASDKAAAKAKRKTTGAAAAKAAKEKAGPN